MHLEDLISTQSPPFADEEFETQMKPPANSHRRAEFRLIKPIKGSFHWVVSLLSGPWSPHKTNLQDQVCCLSQCEML